MKDISTKKENKLNLKKINSNKALISVLICSYLLYLLIFINSFSTNFTSISNYYGSPDADNYVKMSYQLIDEGIYGYMSEESNAYVTPSQPIYITSILMLNKILNVNDLSLIIFFNILLNIGSIILIYFISMKLFKKKNISFVAAFLFAIYFPNVYYVRSALTEIPTIFFMLLSIYVFIKAIESDKMKWYMIFSVFYAITIMFRPALAPFLLICFFIIWKKHGFKNGTKRILYFSVGFFLIVFPWILRNYLLFNELYIFSSHGGNPFLGGTYPFYLEQYDHSIRTGLGMTETEYGKYRIIQGFKSDPKLYLSWFTIGKFLWLFGGPSKWLYYSSAYSNLTLFVYLHHFIIFFAAMFTIFKLRKENDSIKVLSYFAVGYILIHLLFVANDRFGYLIFPILSILAGYSIIKCFEYIKSSKFNITNYFKK
ncbi:MAG: glycosyltransferase family 39 protein [Bacilli bacterium]|nr:glycosyltransferase family 39 protein [Bacilli bacterium]MDD4808781.1 glycosyltransferase family 39 protein [Bacilli bacterium]